MKVLLINGDAQEFLLVEEKLPDDEESLEDEFLTSIGLSEEDLISKNIPREFIRKALSPSCVSRLLEFFTIDRHLWKTLLLFFLDKRGLGDQFENEDKCCQTFLWPQGEVIPFKSTAVLKKVYGVQGFLKTLEKWISRVWSWLLVSFLGNDLYLYYKYPEDRYDMNLVTILLTRSEHEKSLTASLTSPEVWPELFVVPVVWGLLKAIQESCRAQALSAEKMTALIKTLDAYQPSFYRDVFAWFLPVYQVSDALDMIQRVLLWDNRITSEQRILLFIALKHFSQRTKKLTRLHVLGVFGALSQSLALRDLQHLYRAKVSREQLLGLLATKFQALIELQQQAVWQSRGLSNVAAYIKANYFLWLGGQITSKKLSPIFWMYKLSNFYVKAKFFYTACLGFSELVARYIAKRDCENAGKRWLYMDTVADYLCTVCGDLPIFYPDVFDVVRCIDAYSRQPRNASDFIDMYQRLDTRFIKVIDLSHQRFMDQDLAFVLKGILPRTPELEALYLNMSSPVVSALSLQVLTEYLKNSKLKILSLRNQQIGANGTMVLMQGVNYSQLQILDLAYNYIQVEGAKCLAGILTNSFLQELDLFACFIEDEGAAALGNALDHSKLQRVYLGVNNIGDRGLIAFSRGLMVSGIKDLDVWGNAFCSQGATALARSIPRSLIRLVLRNNPCLGEEGIGAIAKALLDTSLEELHCGYVAMHDEGIIALSSVIPKTKLRRLTVRSNEITPYGISRFAAAITTSSLEEIDFSFNYVNKTALEAIARAAIHSRLQTLLLEGCHLDDELMEALSPVLYQPSLRGLYLANNDITARGIQTMRQALLGSHLEYLDLQGNHLGDEGAIMIGNLLPNITLRELSLAANQIQAVGASALGENIARSRLSRFIFYSNTISDEGSEGFFQALRSPALKHLNLGGCNLSDSALEIIARRLPGSAVEILELAYNPIHDAGAEALAGILTNNAFTRRHDWIEAIDADAKRALAKAKPNTRLQRLALEGNAISTNGAKALCRVLPQTDIDVWQLNLADNPIDPAVVDINTCVISAATSLKPSSPYQLIYHLFWSVFPAKFAAVIQSVPALPTPAPRVSRQTSYWDIGILVFYAGTLFALAYKLYCYSRSRHDGPLSYFFKYEPPTSFVNTVHAPKQKVCRLG